MLPLRDVIPSRTTPYITLALILLNSLAWLYELLLPRDALDELFALFGVVPADFNPPTLVTSMFLHGSWFHVVGNMWYLWIFGDNVEDRLGHARYLAFYLICGAGAALGHVVISPDSVLPTIGASGAIAGVMGAYFVLYPRSRVLVLIPLIVVWEIIEIPAVVLLGFWLLLQLFGAGAGAIADTSSAEGGVAFAAHIAGFVLGVVGVFLLKKKQPHPDWSYR
jgi:membrane associated rhomboid family serine protease